MSDMSVNVDVTVWWEDVGGRGERKFLIPLAREAILGRPRPDELLATKLTQTIAFEKWLALEVNLGNRWGSEKLCDRSWDEFARPTEQNVIDCLARIQHLMWISDPQGEYDTKMSVVLKITPEVPHRLTHFIDDVVMPTIPRLLMDNLLARLDALK